MNEIEPSPLPPAPAKSVPGIAQTIGLCVLFYGAVIAVIIVLKLLERFAGVSLSTFSSLLVQQLVAWPLAIWAGLRMSKRSFREACPLTRFPVRIVPALIMASFGVTILLAAVAEMIPMSEAFEDSMERGLAESNKLVAFLSAVVVAPLAEELFFRGLVLRGHLGRYPVTKAVWASAILFAVFHMNPWQAVTALPIGLGFAWLFLRTGSVIPAIVGHAAANSTIFVLPPLALALGYDEEAFKALEQIPPSLLAIGGAMAISGGFVLWRQVADLPGSEYRALSPTSNPLPGVGADVGHERLNVTEIEMHRDGGTITFRVTGDPALEGSYRLQTPRLGEPRPMFRDEVRLAPGSADENELAIALERWLNAALSPERAWALQDLDQLSMWHNLPERLAEVVPLHRVRAVIGCLRARRRT